MTHLSKETLIAYHRNQLELEGRLTLEDHLAQCDQCLDSYLSLVAVELGTAANLSVLSPDFTQGVLQALYLPKTKKSKGIPRRQLIKYYAIAASITLILSATGFFSDVGGRLTQGNEELIRPESVLKIQYPGSWTEWLMDSSSRFKDNIINRIGSDQINE